MLLSLLIFIIVFGVPMGRLLFWLGHRLVAPYIYTGILPSEVLLQLLH